MCRVAIIDTGVRKNHPAFNKEKVQGIMMDKGQIFSEFEDSYGHGTAIYNIIQKESVPDTEIINIKIKNIEQDIDIKDFINALEYVSTLDVDIINLSLGVTICDDLNALYKVCKKLTSQNKILIAAFSNDDSMSYPAAFENVIGVSSDDTIISSNEFYLIEDDMINIAAKGSLQRLAWTYPDYFMLAGNSFACAHVTAIITHIIKDKKNKREIMQILKEKAKKTIYLRKRVEEKKLFPIERAAIFPFSKEMHSIISFQEMLPFKIKAVYDVKYSGYIGASVKHLLQVSKEIEQDFIIKNISKIEWEKIDTLIIGHINKLKERMDLELILKSIIQEAKEKKINIFSFDDLSQYGLKENDSFYYHPTVKIENVPPNRQGKLFRYSKPILGIFGTSSKQGKFTLQLLLRKKFQNLNYKIGQIGTEPTALLYGMDYVFPMGYNSSVQINSYEAVQYLNYCIHNLCQKEYDLIVVGSQSGTVSYDAANLSRCMFSQHSFLLATLPEAIVLCINPFDSFSYIRRTINYIEAVAECKVIAFVIYPMNIQDNWSGIFGKRRRITLDEYKELKQKLKKEFLIDSYFLDKNSEIESLVNDIISFFSDETEEKKN